MSHYNSTVHVAMTWTSSNSHNTFVISSSIISFPSSLSLSLKISYIFKSSIRGMLLPDLIWYSFLIMSFIRFFAFNWCNRLVIVILLLGEIMPLCSYCSEKELVCVTIVSPTGRQSFSCIECMQANM